MSFKIVSDNSKYLRINLAKVYKIPTPKTINYH